MPTDLPISGRPAASALTGTELVPVVQGGVTKRTTPADFPVSTAQAAADTAIYTASRAYADSLIVGLLDDRGNYDASVNTWPASGGSGTAGAILKGDLWRISVAGTLGGVAVTIGDQIRALADTPGQTAGNWAAVEANLGFVPENSAGKDATGGYAGLTGFAIRLKNAAGTITSFLSSAATVARTWTYPDKDGTVAMTSDITGANSGTNTGDNATNTQYSGLSASKANIASPTFTGIVTLPAGQVVNGVTLSTAAGTSNFLRGDGTYAAAGGGGGITTGKAIAMAMVFGG